VGVSVDAEGQTAYRLALQTREQHIRRDKATSNICTAQVLLAVMASMYAVHHGPDGLRAIAERVHGTAVGLAATLRAAGVEVNDAPWFDTLRVTVPGRADAVVAAALRAGVNIWRHDADTVLLSVDETTDPSEVAAVAGAFGAQSTWTEEHEVDASHAPRVIPDWPSGLLRTSEYLTHPVFHSHRSETAMLRYIRRLADRDFALDRGMIPLGSCTMKLNATTEMAAITWPEFAGLHPFAPDDQTVGIRLLVDQLSGWLS